MTVSASALAAYLSANGRKSSVRPRQPGDLVPLSSSQEQVWLHGLIEPDLPLYNETATILYRGVLDRSALEQSIQEIVRRHEIWRTNVRLVDGIPHQFVCAEQPVPFQHLDLLTLPEEERADEARLAATESARRPFDLAHGSLLRILVVKLAEQDYRIFVTLHHLIFDGVSIRSVFLPELIELYSALSRHQPHTLLPPELQYGDYACWQRRRLAESTGDSLEYWKAQLADLPALKLATDRPRTPQTSRRGAVHAFTFAPELTAALRRFSQRERATLFSVICASFSLLLARYSGEQDIGVGTMAAGRTHSELESMLGYFLNTVVLRVDLSGDPNFRELVARVKETTVSALSHAGVPYQDVVRSVAAVRDGREAMIQVAFSLQPPLEPLPPGWGLDVFEVSNGAAKFDLHIEMEEDSRELFGRAIYNTDLFDPATIESFVNHWCILLDASLGEPDRQVWALPLLSAPEQHWLSEELNQTRTEYPGLCLQQLFARQAAKTPSCIAVGCYGQTLTYSELDSRSTQLANYLLGQGIGARSVVALMVARGTEMLVALLAILKSGAAYVPLDPNYPRARLVSMLQGAGADLLVTHSSLRASLPADHPPLLELDRHGPEIARQPDELLTTTSPSLDSGAYIIFTSGSTGQPKGVEISHRALTNLLWSMKHEPGIEPEDTLLAVTSICFDISALELFLPILSGARVEIASAEETADPALLLAALLRSKATILQATPITWRMLIDAGWEGSPIKTGRSLKVLCGGEALTQKLAAELLGRSTSVWNMYGPTETTIWSACCRVTDPSEPIPLGRPIANTALYVLDAHQALAPAGAPGELYIGGDGLATDYWKNPLATSDRFPTVTLEGNAPRRLYRTGDRAIRRRDGSIAFLGRTDRQIKLRGFRIELGDVEQAIRTLPGVRNSAVVKIEDETRDELLAAYVIPEAGAALDPDILRHQLSRLLPAYMRPSIFLIVDDVPLTPNGKLDRGRLPDPLAHHAATARQAPQPGTEETLAAIWGELLQAQKVGRHDDFFELGGHSLLAVRLMARIESSFDQRVPLATLVRAPTIARLADVLAGHAAPSVRVLKSGSSPLKYLVWIGSEPWLHRLARNLADDQSLMTLTIGPESFPLFAPAYSMERMASSLVFQLCELQPEGPYFLGGFCKEALLAYEVAQQLRAQGKEVGLLVLGDVFFPGPFQRSVWERTRMRLRRELSYLSLARPRHLLPSRWFPFLRLRFSALLWHLEHWKWRLHGSRARAAERPETLTQALFIAETAYKIRPYAGNALFLEAARNPKLPHWSTLPGWENLIENLEVFTYPGEHMDLHREPSLSLAVARMQAAMQNAMASQTAADHEMGVLVSASP